MAKRLCSGAKHLCIINVPDSSQFLVLMLLQRRSRQD